MLTLGKNINKNNSDGGKFDLTDLFENYISTNSGIKMEAKNFINISNYTNIKSIIIF